MDISTGGSVNQSSTSGEASGAGTKSNAPTVIAPVAAAAGLLPNSPAVSQSAGRTKAQVRMFYQQTWHKLRRYITFPEEVPLHVREVYAIVNWSVMRSRIKKGGILVFFPTLMLSFDFYLIIDFFIQFSP